MGQHIEGGDLSIMDRPDPFRLLHYTTAAGISGTKQHTLNSVDDPADHDPVDQCRRAGQVDP
jgi:hypothetical protein